MFNYQDDSFLINLGHYDKIPRYKLSPQLTIRKQHQYKTIDSFQKAHYKHYGFHFKENLNHSQLIDDYNEINVHIAPNLSNIYYEKIEIYEIYNKNLGQYDEQKVNKYKLCPYCDPFTNKDDYLSKFVKFYDSLKFEYQNHLQLEHGIFPNGSIFPDPLIGLSLYSGTYTTVLICPNIKPISNELVTQHNCLDSSSLLPEVNTPCLKLWKFDPNDENPFHEYFKHVYDYHEGFNISYPSFDYYKDYIEQSNGIYKKAFFYPLDTKVYLNVCEYLQFICNDENLHPFLLPLNWNHIEKVQRLVYDSENDIGFDVGCETDDDDDDDDDDSTIVQEASPNSSSPNSSSHFMNSEHSISLDDAEGDLIPNDAITLSDSQTLHSNQSN